MDERINPIQFLLGLFKKEEEKPSSGIEKSLKASISLPVLEEKTSQYVKGKIDAKTYYGVLKSAFGDKLKSVLPEILANLPKDKAAALSKF